MKTPEQIATNASAGRARMALKASARADRRPFDMWKISSADISILLAEIRDLCDEEGIPFEAAVYDSAPPIKEVARG